MKSVQHRTLRSTRDYRHADLHRGSAAERGYGWQWSKPGGTRDQAMQRDCYLCQCCLKAGYDTPAVAVDHVIPADVRPEWHHELSNLQALCRECHERKTRRDAEFYGSREDARARKLTEQQSRNRYVARSACG